MQKIHKMCYSSYFKPRGSNSDIFYLGFTTLFIHYRHDSAGSPE